MTMLRNFWYVAALAEEVNRQPVQRILLGVPTALYRTQSGEPVAVRDVCSHRRAPLSLGKLVGDNIECPYHGMQFGPDGRCSLIPSQDSVAEAAHIRAFPVAERQGIVWIWPGDPAAADPAAIPHFPWRASDQWHHDTSYYYHVQASHLLMTDNLLDLGHVAFVHADTIGFDPSALAHDPLVTDVVGDTVRNTRIIPDVEPSPAVQRWGGFTGRIERTSVSTWYPPCFTSIQFGNRDHAANVELRIDHLITPETDETHHYWVFVARNFEIDDDVLTKQMREDNDVVHHQDLVIVEAQQRMIALTPGSVDMAIRQDKGLVQAHRIMDRLAAAERSAATPGTGDPVR
jgi:vanillate O-demethylase monooxygenase subunit